MPIERATYRRYKGKRTSPAMRIWSFSLSDFISRIKRPAVIVILVLFMLYILVTGLSAIMGSIFGEENIFLEDPNPNYNQSLIAQIEVESISVLDANGSNPVHLDHTFLQEVQLSPGEMAYYTLKVSNTGTQAGSIYVNFHPTSNAKHQHQWIPLMMPSENVGDTLAALLAGEDIFGGPGEGTRQEKPEEGPDDDEFKDDDIDDDYKDDDFEDDDYKNDDFEDDDKPDEFNIFEQLLYGQSIPLNLSSRESASVGVVVILMPDSEQDVLELMVSATGVVDEHYFSEHYENYVDVEMSIENQISAVAPLTIVSIPQNGASPPLLRDQIEIELVQISTSARTWTANDIQDGGLMPEVTWGKEMSLKIRVTNTGPATRYVLAFYEIREPEQPFSIHELSTDQAESQTMIPPGQSRPINLTYKPNTAIPQKIYQVSLGLYVSEKEYDISDPWSKDERFFEENIDYIPFEDLENTNERLVVLSHSIDVRSKHYAIEDSTADWFFNLYYTGGIPVLVIFIAVLAGSGLIADDKANSILPLYYSRAIPRFGYILGKFITLTMLLFISTAVLSNLWFIAIMLLGGFALKFVFSHLWIMGVFTMFGLIISLFMSSFVLAGSSLGKNKYGIGASILALFLLFPIITLILTEITKVDNLMLISPTYNILNVGVKLFDLNSLEVDWRLSALVLAGVFVASMALLLFQMTKRETVIQ